MEILRPQRDANYLGAYDGLLGQLSGQVRAADLPAVLAWAAEHVTDGEDAYGTMFPQLVQRGWAQAGSPAVREGLAQLVASLASDPGWPRWPRPCTPPWVGADRGQRRDLAVGVAGTIAPEQSYQLVSLGLLVRDDLGWLVGELPAMPR